ncbi:MAG: ATP-binding protein [Thermoplasmata archaeon]
MALRDEMGLTKALHDQNPWWSSGTVPEALSKPFRRRDFYTLRDKMDHEAILAIIGPRQVGKTTVMHQLAQNLMKRVDPRRILYFSFDYPYLDLLTEAPLTHILETYTTQVLREPVGELTDRIFVFLDEVCKLDGWSEALKGWFDLRRPIKFVLSDSSSQSILRGRSESLAGRIEIQRMLPLKFIDVVGYYEKIDVLKDANYELREALRLAVENDDANVFADAARRQLNALAPHEAKLRIHLHNYMLKDGYPGLLEVDSLPECSRALRTYVDLTTYKDLIRLFDIRDPRALEGLISLIAQESSRRMTNETMARALGLRQETLNRYLDYLESAFLLSRSEFYTRSRVSRMRKSKKLYLTNAGLRNAITGALRESTLQDPLEIGKIAETVAYDHCKRLKYCLERSGPPEIFYWNDRTAEVDMTMELFGKPVPVEVKYRSSVTSSDIRGVKRFMEAYNSPLGMVLTRDDFSSTEKLVLLPLWFFLVMC